MDAKELVTAYYESQAYRNSKILDKFVDNNLVLHWHSSKGYLELDKNDLLALASELEKSYTSSRLDISHIIAEGNNVSVRYIHYVNAFENPNEEMILAHFVVVWEVKNKKMVKGYLMSQLG